MEGVCHDYFKVPSHNLEVKTTKASSENFWNPAKIQTDNILYIRSKPLRQIPLHFLYPLFILYYCFCIHYFHIVFCTSSLTWSPQWSFMQHFQFYALKGIILSSLHNTCPYQCILDIRGFQSYENIICGLLGYHTMWSYMWLPTF